VYAAVESLNRQIRERDWELHLCLEEIRMTRSAKNRKKLSERGNALTAALMPLAVCYENLKVSITSEWTMSLKAIQRYSS